MRLPAPAPSVHRVSRKNPAGAAERHLAEDDHPDDSVVRVAQRSGEMDHGDEQKHHDAEQQAGPAHPDFGGDAQGRGEQAQPTKYTQNKRHGMYAGTRSRTNAGRRDAARRRPPAGRRNTHCSRPRSCPGREPRRTRFSPPIPRSPRARCPRSTWRPRCRRPRGASPQDTTTISPDQGTSTSPRTKPATGIFEASPCGLLGRPPAREPTGCPRTTPRHASSRAHRSGHPPIRRAPRCTPPRRVAPIAWTG